MHYTKQPTSSLIAAYPGKHIDSNPAPESKHAFIALATEELRRLLIVQEGFVSYQTVLIDSQPFDQDFRDHEAKANKRAIDHLREIGMELSEIIGKAESCFSALPMPESLRVDLDYARAAIAHQRAILYYSHIFFKINWSLVLTTDGILPKKPAPS